MDDDKVLVDSWNQSVLLAGRVSINKLDIVSFETLLSRVKKWFKEFL